MTQDAVVIKLLPKEMAEVAVTRGTACGGNCGSCESCMFQTELHVEARNLIQAKPGQKVVISSKSSRIFGAAFLVYIMPLLFFFAGYAVSRSFNIENLSTPGIWEENTGFTVLRTSTIQPWKLEVGFSLTTGLIGLTHGIRLFANLLPTYKDPATGEKIYTSGITLFL